MSDRDFEKQVRQKLDDLRLTPTSASWYKIEQGLRQGKRRRVPFLWIPLIVIAVGLAGYWALNERGRVDRESAIIKRQTADSRRQTENANRQSAIVNGDKGDGRRENAENVN